MAQRSEAATFADVTGDLQLSDPADGIEQPGQWAQVRGIDDLEVAVRLRTLPSGRVTIDGLLLTGEQVSADQLRTIPLGRLERIANPPDVYAADEFFRELHPLYRMKADTPEVFAKRVAMYYNMFASRYRSPAKAISERFNIPVATVRWWISEARRLGALPPGRQGKVG